MGLDRVLQSISLPYVHFSTGSTRVHQIRTLSISDTHHSLGFPCAAECSSLGSETASGLCPELDMLHAGCHKKFWVLGIPFDDKYFVLVSPEVKGT